MADNVTLNPGTGGAVVSTEEVTTLNGGAVSAQQVQRIIPAVRTADGTAVDVVSTAPLPMTLYGSGGNQVIVSSVGGMEVDGSIAHDAVEGGNPVSNGLTAVAHGTAPTAVAAGDRTRWNGNRHGIAFVIGGHPDVKTVAYNWFSTQTNVAIVSATAGQRIIVTAFTVTLSNGHTPSSTFAVTLGFGASATPTTTGVIGVHSSVPAGGGFSRGDGSGIIGIGGDGEDLRLTANSTTAAADLVVTYYLIES